MTFWRKTKPPEPVLSFSEPVQDFVRDTYARATRILEYGSGGSTMLAAELGKPVLSVESDADWTNWMMDCLRAKHPQADAKVIWQDVGKIGGWGKPRGMDAAKNWHNYPLAVFEAGPQAIPPEHLTWAIGRFADMALSGKGNRAEGG